MIQRWMHKYIGEGLAELLIFFVVIAGFLVFCSWRSVEVCP